MYIQIKCTLRQSTSSPDNTLTPSCCIFLHNLLTIMEVTLFQEQSFKFTACFAMCCSFISRAVTGISDIAVGHVLSPLTSQLIKRSVCFYWLCTCHPAVFTRVLFRSRLTSCQTALLTVIPPTYRYSPPSRCQLTIIMLKVTIITLKSDLPLFQ